MEKPYIQKKIKILILSLLIAIPLPLNAQTADFRITKAETTSNSNAILEIVVYCKDKKKLDKEAKVAALRAVMFNGCPGTPYNKALLENGEQTCYQESPSYFENLWSERYADFIVSAVPISKFKKADKQKGTSYKIEVRVMQLRKDLEKNKIKKRFGL